MSSPSLPAAGPGSAQVRSQLVTALEVELIGPTQRVLRALGAEAEGLETEALDRLPSSCYPTGFLVPTETDLSLKCDDTADDDFAAADGVDLRKPKKANSEYKSGSGDDGGSSEPGPAKPQLFPSSIGVSVLLPPGGELQLIARWADYSPLEQGEQQIWQRTARVEALPLSHTEITSTKGLTGRPWPNSNGLHLRWHCRPAPLSQGYAPGTVAVTLFLTNERKKAITLVERDQHSAFQAELEVRCPQRFVARLDPHASRASGDWDEAVNALQFRDACEYGVGHNVGCELAMEELDRLASQGFVAIRTALTPLVERYQEWISEQAAVAGLNAQQQATAEQLLANAKGQARAGRGLDPGAARRPGESGRDRGNEVPHRPAAGARTAPQRPGVPQH